MNTGTHDAVNLAWKLGGILRGWYRPKILSTYEDERRPAAQHLIKVDKDFSSLISGDIPAGYEGSSLSAVDLHAQVFEENIQFTIGLGVHYDGDSLFNRAAKAGSVTVGWRALDALLYSPGSKTPARLQQLTPNHSSYWIVVFAGEPISTKQKLCDFRIYFDSENSIFRRAPSESIGTLTIIRGVKNQGDAALGVPSLVSSTTISMVPLTDGLG